MKKIIMILTFLLLGFNAYGCGSISKIKNNDQLIVKPTFKIDDSVPKSDKFEFPGLVGNSMILQRNTVVLLWGNYDKDGPVSADVGGSRFFGECVNGKFEIYIETTDKKESFDIIIYSASEKAVIHDVLFGEVYLCAGQSNMQINMEYIKAPELKENIDDDNMRFVYVPVQTCDKPVSMPVGDVPMSWQKLSSAVLPNYSAVAYYFSKVMYQKLDVPIGIIWVAAGDTIIASWLPNEEAKSIPDFYQEDRPPYFVRTPAHMYNTMISPILKYKARGVIWYQGENQDKQYDEFLTKLINVWRKDFKNEALEFTIVQLPGCGASWISKWAEIREYQKKVTSTLPLCAMSINIDCGDEVEIHPVDKKPIGERAAYATLSKFFSMKGLPQNPMVKSYKTAGNTLEIEFENTGSGLVLKNNGEGFEIAAEDFLNYKADAKIENNKLILSCKDVSRPNMARYAFSNMPVISLYNNEGMPAEQFNIKVK